MARGRNTKTILILGLPALILATVLGVWIWTGFSSVARVLAQEVVSHALGVPVSIEVLDIDLATKTVLVSGIKIENPPAYRGRDPAISIGSVVIRAESLASDLLVLADVAVTDLSLNMQVRQDGTNLSELRRGLRPQDESATARAPLIIIRDLIIADARLNPAVTLLRDKPEPLILPDIRLRGIGERENGIPASRAAARITDHLVRVTLKTALQASYFEGLSDSALVAMDIESSMGQKLDRGLQGVESGLKKLFGQ